MSRKKNAPRKGRLMRRLAKIAAALAVLLVIYMAVEASVVNLQYADVYLADLPAPFENARILFLSDLHVDAFNRPGRAAALVMQLQALNPDLLILGGDYAAYTPLDFLQAALHLASPFELKRREQARRDQFFLLIKDFSAPMGKYGVAGNHDLELDDLRESMALGGITLLQNESARVEHAGAHLSLVGLDDWTTGAQAPRELALQARAGDCTVVISHTPDALPALSNYPAPDGGRWIDLMLSGHTHGGQITLFGLRPLLLRTQYGDRYWRGWYIENGARLLVSSGVGTTGLPLRLGAPPQAHLITLRKLED